MIPRQSFNGPTGTAGCLIVGTLRFGLLTNQMRIG
jgi:hypothetical protein